MFSVQLTAVIGASSVKPPIVVLLVVGGLILSLAVGSFVNVIIDRMPYALDEPDEFGDVWGTRTWREVAGGHSRCSSCGEPVRPYDNIPVVSWLLLRGRCRSCDARIPAFHVVVEALFPITVGLVIWGTGFEPRLANALWLIPAGFALSVIDLRTLIMPTRIIRPATVVAVAISAVVCAVQGEWRWMLGGLVGAAVLGGILFGLWYLVNGMGYGDVRLSLLIGWTVGFAAATVTDRLGLVVFLTILTLTLASIVGIILGIVLKVGFGQVLPFGPPLIAATLFCTVFADSILRAF